MQPVSTVSLHLAVPPTVAQIGLNQHGRMAVERFRMRTQYALHLYHYHGWLEVDGVRHDFAPGSISVTPPGVDLAWHFPRQATHYYAHLLLPDAGGRRVEVPLITPCPHAAQHQALRSEFALALSSYRSLPGRTTAIIWEMLWRLVPDQDPIDHRPCPAAGTVVGGGEPLHPALHTVLSQIEDRLDEHLDLGTLAAQVAMSKTHLIRLFHRHCGMTVMQWIKHRRMERARELLRTGSMSIQAVAAAVGLPDPHRFNKLVRSHWGMSPSRLRGQK